MYRLGMDLGGTKIEGIALENGGREVFRKRVATDSHEGHDAILDRITALYLELVAAVDGAEHTFGIGTPGSISKTTGLMKNSNTLCLNGQPVKTELEERLGRGIEIQNDANCFALAEAVYGAGRGKDLVFGVIMGTGCGGGIVYKGKVLAGLAGNGGEWGHMSIDPEGPECYCGNRGCVETFISGGGLQRLFLAEQGEELSLRQIADRAEQGDETCRAFMARFYDRFGRALANLINILDPDLIVLGGGVSNLPGLYSQGVEAVRKYVFNDALLTPIVQHELGDSAGVLGAALIGI